MWKLTSRKFLWKAILLVFIIALLWMSFATFIKSKKMFSKKEYCMRKIIFLLAIILFLIIFPVYAANVTGTWTLTMIGPQDEETFDLAITADGNNLAIMTTHPKLGEMKGTGTIDNDTVKMNIVATGHMAIEFVFDGKVTDSKMSGTREIKMTAGGGPGSPGGPGGPSGCGGPPEGRGGGDINSIKSNAWSALRK
jgi:hypothetical protein